mmetsp:Transcript_16234/g.23802  ORF Transcript_16234/g.23802 Transcript_16234/m.23802 type:complete len:290 (+) Transcript_16234:748-1617(+)
MSQFHSCRTGTGSLHNECNHWSIVQTVHQRSFRLKEKTICKLLGFEKHDSKRRSKDSGIVPFTTRGQIPCLAIGIVPIHSCRHNGSFSWSRCCLADTEESTLPAGRGRNGSSSSVSTWWSRGRRASKSHFTPWIICRSGNYFLGVHGIGCGCGYRNGIIDGHTWCAWHGGNGSRSCSRYLSRRGSSLTSKDTEWIIIGSRGSSSNGNNGTSVWIVIIWYRRRGSIGGYGRWGSIGTCTEGTTGIWHRRRSSKWIRIRIRWNRGYGSRRSRDGGWLSVHTLLLLLLLLTE